MGVSHYIACKQCKKYVDVYKSYHIASIFYGNTRDIASDKGSYHLSRALWFVCKHREHGKELFLSTDEDWGEDVKVCVKFDDDYEEVLKIE